jgi:hypothetical protein
MPPDGVLSLNHVLNHTTSVQGLGWAGRLSVGRILSLPPPSLTFCVYRNSCLFIWPKSPETTVHLHSLCHLPLILVLMTLWWLLHRVLTHSLVTSSHHTSMMCMHIQHTHNTHTLIHSPATPSKDRAASTVISSSATLAKPSCDQKMLHKPGLPSHADPHDGPWAHPLPIHSCSQCCHLILPLSTQPLPALSGSQASPCAWNCLFPSCPPTHKSRSNSNSHEARISFPPFFKCPFQSRPLTFSIQYPRQSFLD